MATTARIRKSDVKVDGQEGATPVAEISTTQQENGNGSGSVPTAPPSSPTVDLGKMPLSTEANAYWREKLSRTPPHDRAPVFKTSALMSQMRAVALWIGRQLEVADLQLIAKKDGDEVVSAQKNCETTKEVVFQPLSVLQIDEDNFGSWPKHEGTELTEKDLLKICCRWSASGLLPGEPVWLGQYFRVGSVNKPVHGFHWFHYRLDDGRMEWIRNAPKYPSSDGSDALGTIRGQALAKCDFAGSDYVLATTPLPLDQIQAYLGTAKERQLEVQREKERRRSASQKAAQDATEFFGGVESSSNRLEEENDDGGQHGHGGKGEFFSGKKKNRPELQRGRNQ